MRQDRSVSPIGYHDVALSVFAKRSPSHEANLAGEELLHHGLLEGAGLFAAALQGLQLRVHLARDLVDGGLIGGRRFCDGG